MNRRRWETMHRGPSLYVALFTLEQSHILKFGFTGDVDLRINSHLTSRAGNPWYARLGYGRMLVEIGFNHRWQARHAETTLKRAAIDRLSDANRWEPADEPRLPTNENGRYGRGYPSGEWMFMKRGPNSAAYLLHVYSWLAEQSELPHLKVPYQWARSTDAEAA